MSRRTASTSPEWMAATKAADLSLSPGPAVGCGLEHLIGHPHPPGFVLQELRQLRNVGRGEIPLLHLTSIASLQPSPPNGTSCSLVITEGQMVTTTQTSAARYEWYPRKSAARLRAVRPDRRLRGDVLRLAGPGPEEPEGRSERRVDAPRGEGLVTGCAAVRRYPNPGRSFRRSSGRTRRIRTPTSRLRSSSIRYRGRSADPPG